MKETLVKSHEDHLAQVIELTWKFVTLPNPIIVCQPEGFDGKIHEPEFGYWDKRAKKLPLVYTQPVVYRNYEGVLASKGRVANTDTGQQSWCVLS